MESLAELEGAKPISGESYYSLNSNNIEVGTEDFFET